MRFLDTGKVRRRSGPFMEWAPSWARRAVLKQAIRMMMPGPGWVDQLSRADSRGRRARSRQSAPFPYHSQMSMNRSNDYKGYGSINGRSFVQGIASAGAVWPPTLIKTSPKLVRFDLCIRDEEICTHCCLRSHTEKNSFLSGNTLPAFVL